MTGVYDPKLKVWRYDLDESTAAAASLKTHTTADAPNTTAEAAALAAFQKLPLHHQKRTLDYLSKTLRAHHDDGVKDVAGSNRAGLKDNAAHNANSLADIKRDFKKFWPQVKESTLDQMVEAYTSQVEAGARSIILELLSSDPAARLAFANQETLDQVAAYCYHIEALEQAIIATEAENAELRDQKMFEEMQQMHEDILYHQPASPAARRRSLQFEEPSADNANLMNEETTRHLDPAMRNYLSAVERGSKRS